MICPKCGKQMKIGYVRGVYILWKCPYCEYADIIPSDKVNGKRGEGKFKTESGGEEKPPKSTHL